MYEQKTLDAIEQYGIGKNIYNRDTETRAVRGLIQRFRAIKAILLEVKDIDTENEYLERIKNIVFS